MRYLFFIIAALIITASGIYGFGANLPREHKISRTAIYHQAPNVLWQTLADYQHAPEWSSSVERVERLEDKDGMPVWRFHDTRGHWMDIQALKSESPALLVSRIVATDTPFGGMWTIELEPSDDGATTAVTLTEEGYIDSPLWRFMMHFVVGKTAMIDQYLSELGRKFDETPQISG